MLKNDASAVVFAAGYRLKAIACVGIAVRPKAHHIQLARMISTVSLKENPSFAFSLATVGGGGVYVFFLHQF
jgi:hypothetical protein